MYYIAFFFLLNISVAKKFTCASCLYILKCDIIRHIKKITIIWCRHTDSYKFSIINLKWYQNIREKLRSRCRANFFLNHCHEHGVRILRFCPPLCFEIWGKKQLVVRATKRTTRIRISLFLFSSRTELLRSMLLSATIGWIVFVCSLLIPMSTCASPQR